MRRFLKRTVVVGAAATAAVVIRQPRARAAFGRARRDLGRRARHLRGMGAGVWYRLSGRHPDPNVSDDVLTQRVRSTLGPLEKELDLPRVHVMVEDGLVLLHGEVSTGEAAHEIDRAVLRVPGVRGVESYLHIGLSKGSTRPSEGHLQETVRPSAARVALVEAARRAGMTEHDAPRAVRAVLATFTDRIPEDERDQLLAHLPADTRLLAGPPRRHGAAPTRVRTVEELVAAVNARGAVDAERAHAVTRAVVAELRALVPEEVADVAAVLPEPLRTLWTAPAPA